MSAIRYSYCDLGPASLSYGESLPESYLASEITHKLQHGVSLQVVGDSTFDNSYIMFQIFRTLSSGRRKLLPWVNSDWVDRSCLHDH